MSAIKEAWPRNGQEHGGGEGVEERRRAATVQVAAFVAEFGRRGEGPECGLRVGGCGDEARVVEGEGVEADGFIGGGRGSEFVVEGEHAVGGRQGEVGVLVGSDSTGHREGCSVQCLGCDGNLRAA